jgi:DNA-binding Xre family transcriptional regulator
MLKINERNVRVFMADRGINTVEELAKKAGVSSVTIRRLFAGEEFRSSSLHSLAQALNCNPLDLLTVEGYPDPHCPAQAFAVAA